jgi:glycosyltransferase involved in cell wall biosynthesis
MDVSTRAGEQLRNEVVLSNRPFLNVVIAAWAPFHAGAEIAAERLACGLREAGHDVSLLLGTHGETLERARDLKLDVRFIPLAFTDKWHPFRYQRAQQQLRRLLDELQPDVVHANDLPTSHMVGQGVRRERIPLVCHHRWMFQKSAIDWLNKFGAERNLFVSRALQSYLCRESSRLASCSNNVVYDGLALPPLPCEDERIAARQALKLPLDKRIVLFAGQIIERKGVADLLHAWSLLTSELSEHAELVIVGDDLESSGAYRCRMESLARQINSPARFMGFQRNVAQWLTAADICVVPSHEEPLGNATLEAMAHARPVIGCEVGGIPEMIVDEKTGLLVPPKNPAALCQALSRLLNDPSRAAALGDAGRRRCEALFSLRAHVNDVCEEYHEVLAHRLAETGA